MRLLPLAVLLLALIFGGFTFPGAPADPAPSVRVGAAAVELEADDEMVIGGGILPGKAAGQDGKLRAVAAVIEKPGSGKVAIIACDVLMMNRDLLDPAAEEVARALGIPESHV